LAGKTRSQNDLLSVEWDVKLYTLTVGSSTKLFISIITSLHVGTLEPLIRVHVVRSAETGLLFFYISLLFTVFAGCMG